MGAAPGYNLAGAGATGSSFSTVALADGDAGVAQTIELMRSLVLYGDPGSANTPKGAGSRVDPYIRSVAGQLVAPLDPRDQVSHAQAIFDWVRDHVRFVRDPNSEELVQNPRWTLQYGFGDCDDITTLLCSLCESVGIPAEFITVSLAGEQFDHVYAAALIGPQPIPMDIARMNPQFGVTSTQVFRMQEWPIDPETNTTAIGGDRYRSVFQRSQLHGAIATLGDNGDAPDTFDPSTFTTYTVDANGQTTTYLGVPGTATYYDNLTGQEVTNPYYNNPAAAQAAENAFYGNTVTAQQIAALPTGMTPAQIAQLVSAGGNSAAAIIKAINTPQNPYYNPQSPYFGIGGVPLGSSNLFGITGLSTNMLLLAFGALLLVSSRK